MWAYIADNAHPHLRVSKTKELGYWDSLHTKYAGCRVGDYLQLQTADMAEAASPSQQQQPLPICEALGNWLQAVPEGVITGRPQPWSASSVARLQPSKDCSFTQKLLQLPVAPQQGTTGPDSGNTASTATVKEAQHLPGSAPPSPAGLQLPGNQPPPKPWWGAWQDRSSTSKGAQQQQHLTEPTAVRPDGLILQQPPDSPDLDVTSSSSRRLVQAMGAASNTILGAPAQLDLPDLTFPQPMYHADITPRYMFDPAVPARVRSLLPEARIIVILRGEGAAP